MSCNTILICYFIDILSIIINKNHEYWITIIKESVDSISRDKPDSPYTQYITDAGISRGRYTITHFKQHHCVVQLIFPIK